MNSNNILALLDHPDLHKALKANPDLAQELRGYQAELQKMTLAYSQELAGEMRKSQPTKDTTSYKNAQPSSVAGLRSAASRRESEALAVKQSAEDIVFTTIVNAGNPYWNPQDAGTYSSPQDSVLVKLMNTQLG